MRWEDERYVRVFTRDTAEWIALGWEAQSLLVALFRKADRAGIVALGKTGFRGIAGVTGFPLEVVERALPVLIEDGCVEQTPTAIVVPNFIEAQETPQSDRARKREQRERARGQARASVTKRDGSSRNVTDGHETGTESHAESRDVTAGHAESRAVTPCCADPFRAVPDQIPPTPQGGLVGGASLEDAQTFPKSGKRIRPPSQAALLPLPPAEAAVVAAIAADPSLAPLVTDAGPIAAKLVGLASRKGLDAAESVAAAGRHCRTSNGSTPTARGVNAYLTSWIKRQDPHSPQSEGGERTQKHYGRRWEKRTGATYTASQADRKQAEKLWIEALREANGDEEVAREWAQHWITSGLAERDLESSRWPLAIILSRIGRYGSPTDAPPQSATMNHTLNDRPSVEVGGPRPKSIMGQLQ
jgi:hypothetical protein